jgi:hypothetical protein
MTRRIDVRPTNAAAAYFSPPELAEHLGVRVSWIYDNSWLIPGRVKFGRHLRFRCDAVSAWLAGLEDHRDQDTGSDSRVLDCLSRLVAKADLTDSGVPAVPMGGRKATTAPPRRGRRPPADLPSRGDPS